MRSSARSRTTDRSIDSASWKESACRGSAPLPQGGGERARVKSEFAVVNSSNIERGVTMLPDENKTIRDSGDHSRTVRPIDEGQQIKGSERYSVPGYDVTFRAVGSCVSMRLGDSENSGSVMVWRHFRDDSSGTSDDDALSRRIDEGRASGSVELWAVTDSQPVRTEGDSTDAVLEQYRRLSSILTCEFPCRPSDESVANVLTNVSGVFKSSKLLAVCFFAGSEAAGPSAAS
jgi:hypothetical protein